ncbi:phytanoyl-CoA dioxygenase family protein [Massilia endophytica]|uniref:phytanoyl-CoA dioxygenase family protein n=1 Tax=Massilia endophytica TaxID=2899220 RepID=UPI001E54EDD5|nr:phytanoyl-CoA dioxygenase family protein [Massilia endophytica]UGQ46194.1 phytanoyl-CoA dioxygenase family protein [Massilia endophytica]
MRYARLTPGHGFKPSNSFLYYLQRIIVSPPLRGVCVKLFRQWVRVRQGVNNGRQSALRDQQLAALHAEGYVALGALFSREQCEDIQRYFADKVLTDRHDERTRFTIDAVPDTVRLGEYSLRDIVACPHILALANSETLLSLAERYIGCKPTISQLGVRWSFPKPDGRSDLQTFHRDSEDWRYFKVLVYLTDVGPGEGPHVYVRGTHRTRAPLRLHLQSDAEIDGMYGRDMLITAMGERGFGFAVDTAGVHKGAAPSAGRRLMLQIQYSLFRSYAYLYQPEPYHGALPLDRYINRLIVA